MGTNKAPDGHTQTSPCDIINPHNTMLSSVIKANFFIIMTGVVAYLPKLTSVFIKQKNFPTLISIFVILRSYKQCKSTD